MKFSTRAGRLAALLLIAGSSFAYAGDKLSDPQIAHIAYTAGVLDVKAAEQALRISKNKDVLEFAKNMVTDHKEDVAAFQKKLAE